MVYLADRRIECIIAGEKRVDLRVALEQLKDNIIWLRYDVGRQSV